jgi:hypothetical protein
MPFVLRSGEKWIKNNDSDFYLDFSAHVTNSTKVLVTVYFRLQTLNYSDCIGSFTCLLLIKS